MILSSQAVKKLEADAFAAGVSAEALMDQAGLQVAQAVEQFFPTPGTALIYFGKGHNGGDALVAARHLAAGGWTVRRRQFFQESDLSALTRKKLEAAAPASLAIGSPPQRVTERPLVVLDGLLGVGVTGALREPIRGATREINRLRDESYAHVFAIDLPTGLDGDTGEADPDCVVADFTLTIGVAKTGLVADGAANFVGRLAVLPLPELDAAAAMWTGPQRRDGVATARELAPLLARRKFDTHKTNYGRVGIVAGSRGFTGAALMAAEAALRAGAGLITVFVLDEIYGPVASAAPPEVMVQPVPTYRDVLDAKLDVIVIGPGLGRRHDAEILELVEMCGQPMVVDADALNALSTEVGLLAKCAGPRLLTPHPGEMARLLAAPASGGHEPPASPRGASASRREIVEHFTEKFPVTLLLKGARTLIGERGKPLSYNPTGSPGMATGGMGDVLTGLCAALIAQGLPPYDAARAGAWLGGRAAEIAIYNGNRSEESLSATDLFDTLGIAFKQMRAGCF
jgi:ADP-dependent NAD(P)H-hydrate dehydratase / NAD(P)H-hydrate epimerase